MYTILRSYPSFLVFLAIVLSVFFVCCIMPFFIKFMRSARVGQQVRDDGPQTHLKKQGTPTMGGIVMIISLIVTIFLVGIPDAKTGALLFVAIASGVIGLVDDYKKVHLKNTDGMSAKGKLILQFLIAACFILFAVNRLNVAPTIVIPFVGILDLSFFTSIIPLFGSGEYLVIPWIYLVFCLILLVGMCNAVNLTDGLDGLAAGTVMMVLLVISAIAYRLNVLEPSIFAAAFAGTCIGFLWFNSNPASVFMGDTGSLSLGMSIGCLAILTKMELLIILIGGLFVLEALSVMIQVFWFKKTGKRVFLMAPLHHHFEKKGWGENKVVVRFWMISGLLAASGFAIFFAGSIF